MKNSLFLLALLALSLFSCDDDDTQVNPPEATTASFTVTIENVTIPVDFFASNVFNTPEGTASPGVAVGGEAYVFTFNARPGQRLSFATMYVQTNDLFFAFDDEGIALYDNNNDPISGDLTSQVQIWDAGTEVNQEPGVGDAQAPRQGGPDVGTEESEAVRLIADVNDGFTYPAANELINVSISNDGGTEFTVRLENVSGDNDTPMSPLSPGVWVVHESGTPLFTEGEVDAEEGLEAIAEDGDATTLGAFLADNSGLVSPLSPGAYVVHSDAVTFFTEGQADAGLGIEGIAEDGDPSNLVASLDGVDGVSGVVAFNTPVGAASPGPIGPGGSYEFTFTASEGEFLSLATMFIQSNDLFYAFEPEGIALFNNGVPINGDVTNQLALWDAGTEVNEFPGVGANQAPRQSGPDTGEVEDGTIEEITNFALYPPTNEVIRITVTSTIQ